MTAFAGNNINDSGPDWGHLCWVTVWDAHRSIYRRVNLHDQEDPLWLRAMIVAMHEDAMRHMPQPGVDRQPADSTGGSV